MSDWRLSVWQWLPLILPACFQCGPSGPMAHTAEEIQSALFVSYPFFSDCTFVMPNTCSWFDSIMYHPWFQLFSSAFVFWRTNQIHQAPGVVLKGSIRTCEHKDIHALPGRLWKEPVAEAWKYLDKGFIKVSEFLPRNRHLSHFRVDKPDGGRSFFRLLSAAYFS